MDAAHFFNNDCNPMIWHAFLVGALFHAHQIAGLKLHHFKRASALASVTRSTQAGASQAAIRPPSLQDQRGTMLSWI